MLNPKEKLGLPAKEPLGAHQLAETYLQPTQFLDFEHPVVQTFAIKNTSGAETNKEKAIKLFYAVRDAIRYDPYNIDLSGRGMTASTTLQRGYGFCITKAVLLAAVARFHGIPARLGFADVTNHLSTKKLRETMGTNLFIYHGYTELWLGKWIKATPTFNLSLCARFNVRPLEFDGENDSLFHQFDANGQKHLEYVHDHGHFADLPHQTISEALITTYPRQFQRPQRSPAINFELEAQQENIEKA